MLRAMAATLLIVSAAGAARIPRIDAANGEIRKADGTQVGTARISRNLHGVAAAVLAQGLAPGRYGVHVHAVGRCEGPGFESAGPHWNPTTRQHGRLNPEGHHLGDLPNLEIGADGTGRSVFDIDEGTLAALIDADGASVVIHAAADDERTDPSGNSGARIACAVLRMAP